MASRTVYDPQENLTVEASEGEKVRIGGVCDHALHQLFTQVCEKDDLRVHEEE